MRLGSIKETDGSEVAVVITGRGVARVTDLLPDAGSDLLALIRQGRVEDVAARVETSPASVWSDEESVSFTAPYRHPRLIWGIGLNYVDHAGDLSEQVPEEPASFVKGDHTIVGPGEPIPIPIQSERTTSEAELGFVIGRHCRNVEEHVALDYVLGVVPILDQTAEDILQKNPRFLTRSKNFPGFFSFGPQIVPLNEAVGAGDLADIEVSTVRSDGETRSNVVANMRYSPAFLISFHSKVMPLEPGDILSPGTPGALHIRPGDTMESRIPGVGVLRNPVVQG